MSIFLASAWHPWSAVTTFLQTPSYLEARPPARPPGWFWAGAKPARILPRAPAGPAPPVWLRASTPLSPGTPTTISPRKASESHSILGIPPVPNGGDLFFFLGVSFTLKSTHLPPSMCHGLPEAATAMAHADSLRTTGICQLYFEGGLYESSTLTCTESGNSQLYIKSRNSTKVLY